MFSKNALAIVLISSGSATTYSPWMRDLTGGFDGEIWVSLLMSRKASPEFLACTASEICLTDLRQKFSLSACSFSSSVDSLQQYQSGIVAHQCDSFFLLTTWHSIYPLIAVSKALGSVLRYSRTDFFLEAITDIFLGVVRFILCELHLWWRWFEN